MTRRLCVALAALLVLSACVSLGPEKDTTRFFVLSPEPATDSIRAVPDGPLLAVGPVTIPSYLDRPAIVTRVGPNQVDPVESDRWAQSLASMVQRTLAVDLGDALGARQYLLYPWARDYQPDIVVEVDILRFEADRARTVRLDALWRLRLGGEEQIGTTALSQAVADTTTESVVAAMSSLLASMSEQLAREARR